MAKRFSGPLGASWDAATDFKRRAFEVIGPKKALLADGQIPAGTKKPALAGAAVSDRVPPRP